MLNLNKKAVFTVEEMESRRKVTRKYANIGEMEADGWTDRELEMLIQAPHTQSGVSCLPIIDGFSCPASLWTESERQAYNEYKKGLKDGIGSTGTSPSGEKAKKIEAIFEYAKSLGDKKLIDMVAELMPTDPVAMKLFGREPVDGEKFSVDWVMYRDANGQRFENQTGNIMEFCSLARGVIPAILPAALDSMLEKNPKYKAFMA